MNEPEEDDVPAAPPPRRSSAPAAMATVAVMGGLAIGVLLFQLHRERPERISTTGLDLDAAPEPEAPPATTAAPGVGAAAPRVGAAAQEDAGSTFGLAPIAPRAQAPSPPPMGDPGPQENAAADPKARAGDRFVQAVRRNEAVFRDLTLRYQRKHPVFMQWATEWMSHPDLNQACKGYWRDRNAIRFAFDVASSPNFAKMVGKYAKHSELHAFVRDAAKAAPQEIVQSLTDYFRQDGTAVTLAEKFAAAAGLPPALLAGLTGRRVDQKAVMSQILDSNPELERALRNQPR